MATTGFGGSYDRFDLRNRVHIDDQAIVTVTDSVYTHLGFPSSTEMEGQALRPPSRCWKVARSELAHADSWPVDPPRPSIRQKIRIDPLKAG